MRSIFSIIATLNTTRQLEWSMRIDLDKSGRIKTAMQQFKGRVG